MMNQTLLAEIQKLSVEDRMELLALIWEGIHAETPVPTFTKEQVQELDRRLESIQRSPEKGLTIEQLEERLSRMGL